MVKVYLVDDSVLFLNELTLTVPWERMDCKVVGSALDAETAEREIREMRPDLIITDISMPGRDGLEMVESLADIPGPEFIVVSAYPKFEYAFRAIKLKTADYFVKPFDDEEFYRAVERVAQRISARQRAAADASRLPGIYSGHTHNNYIEAALQYVDDHYAEDLSAASVAKALFISESYLSKCFRRELNTSFKEYLNYIRIRKAMLLFRTTDLKIYEVAEQTGFGTPKYFATIFRKLAGITPTQYRNSVRD
ncbi:MAG TPA: helix-turn-helix domain-containing protein [Candidatus Faecivicinus avistercoris]|nr:helix-turn-helix domain-containing protein [Candidatus Faecivicinus avistercoris]